MKQTIKLNPTDIKPIRTIDKRLVSYNIEMTEVTGGTFWKAYTPGQIAGTEAFSLNLSELKDFTSLAGLMQYYQPINLYDSRLRELAKKLGSAWIRVSGTWATKTYYDFDGTTDGKAPEGYQSVLTKEAYRRNYTSEKHFRKCTDSYIQFYNEIRPHQTLNYETPQAFEERYRKRYIEKSCSCGAPE